MIMADSLAIISGKGGSGKTTLAISLAQLLSSCGKRVLLADCDMSTHGATYFFEGMLSNKNKYHTVVGLLSKPSQENDKLEFLNVSESIWFLPSCVDFPSKNNFHNGLDDTHWNYFYNVVSKMDFDVVIYDCQAGYSVVTEIVTKYSNKNLAIIEADAISASSLRVLYAQLSENLDRGNTYQIFNKITKEEQDVYSKLTHGTLFTNLSPILFDWSVRKAFITNELPDIDASNPILTNSVYDLAIALFPNYRNDMREFLLNIKKDILAKLEDDASSVRSDMRKRMIEMYTTIIPALLSFMGVVITTLLFLERGVDSPILLIDNYMFFMLITVLLTMFLASFMSLLLKRSNRNDDTRKLKRKRQLLEDEIADITRKLQK